MISDFLGRPPRFPFSRFAVIAAAVIVLVFFNLCPHNGHRSQFSSFLRMDPLLFCYTIIHIHGFSNKKKNSSGENFPGTSFCGECRETVDRIILRIGFVVSPVDQAVTRIARTPPDRRLDPSESVCNHGSERIKPRSSVRLELEKCAPARKLIRVDPLLELADRNAELPREAEPDPFTGILPETSPFFCAPPPRSFRSGGALRRKSAEAQRHFSFQALRDRHA